MSRVLVLKCEHMAEVMEISDLTVSSVEGMFMGVVSTVAYTGLISFDGRKSFQTNVA